MPVKYALIERKLLADRRGWLLKLIAGTEPDLPHATGEIYAVHGVAGEPRGNHYHRLAAEWFTLVSGKVRCLLADSSTNERLELRIDFADAVTLYVPPFTAHCFFADEASPDPVILIAYSSHRYHPDDTVPYDFDSV